MTKVLLVEDEEMSLDMLRRRLVRRGFDVVEAVDGEQAIRKARDESPDLILMDMSLPVMDGWEATRLLKESSETATIPVVALTAHAMTGDRERALSAGCDAYTSKPVDLKRLIETMQELLESRARPGS